MDMSETTSMRDRARGQMLFEFGIILMLVLVVAIAGVAVFGGSVSGALSEVGAGAAAAAGG
jgi:Flp pilus assembly pilin Flp